MKGEGARFRNTTRQNGLSGWPAMVAHDNNIKICKFYNYYSYISIKQPETLALALARDIVIINATIIH